jgi:cell division septum initiation protein DivIVA
MDKDEIIEQLLATIAQLKQENELLRGRIAELEARLSRYENAHTPPSLRRGGNRKRYQNACEKGKPNQKAGHKA